MKKDRLLGILMILLRRGKTTAPELARHFEVSRRTISRDVDALAQAGVPVHTEQGAGGGILLDAGFRLEGAVLDGQQAADVRGGLSALSSVSDEAHYQKLLDLFSVQGAAEQTDLLDLSSFHRTAFSEKLTLLRKAIRERRQVAFVYYMPEGQALRRVEPYYVLYRYADWYLYAYDLGREGYRTFKLRRLWEAHALAEPYAPRGDSMPPDKGHHLPDERIFVARFVPEMRYRLVEEYEPGCFTEDADGWLRLSRGFTNDDYLVSWILSFGSDVKLLSPPEIVARVAAHAARMRDYYSEDAEEAP